jgi:hypothetical protein
MLLRGSQFAGDDVVKEVVHDWLRNQPFFLQWNQEGYRSLG